MASFENIVHQSVLITHSQEHQQAFLQQHQIGLERKLKFPDFLAVTSFSLDVMLELFPEKTGWRPMKERDPSIRTGYSSVIGIELCLALYPTTLLGITRVQERKAFKTTEEAAKVASIQLWMRRVGTGNARWMGMS